MRAQLIFIASIICLTLVQVVSTEKYPFIGKCRVEHYNDGHYRDLTFICDRITVVHNDCFSTDDSTSTYTAVFPHYFYKSAISKIDFENCDQPTIFNTTFSNYRNVNDLDMSHLGITTDRISFLAEPNKLEKIDASYNNIAEILDGNNATNQSLVIKV